MASPDGSSGCSGGCSGPEAKGAGAGAGSPPSGPDGQSPGDAASGEGPKRSCKCVCECQPPKIATELCCPQAGASAPEGVIGRGAEGAEAPGDATVSPGVSMQSGGGPSIAVGTPGGTAILIGAGTPSAGQWRWFQGGAAAVSLPTVGSVQVGGGDNLGKGRGILPEREQPRLRKDSVVAEPVPPIRSPIADGLQADAALSPAPGGSFGETGPAEAAAPLVPLVAPAYSLRRHPILEVSGPLPVAPSATGCFDLVGERGAPNSGIGASFEPETHDGCSRAGVWREWTGRILAPPIAESEPPLDLTDARYALGVEAPAGAFVNEASVGLLEAEDDLEDLKVSPPQLPPSSGDLDAESGAQEEATEVVSPDARLPGTVRPPAMEGLDEAGTTPAFSPKREGFQGRKAALAPEGAGQFSPGAELARILPRGGGGLSVAPSAKPSARPPVFSKPGSGRGGGIAGSVATTLRKEEETTLRSYPQLTREYDPALAHPGAVDDETYKDARAQEDKEYNDLVAQAERAKEDARKNFNNPETFEKRWSEEEERQRQRRLKEGEREERRNAADPRRADVKMANKSAGVARDARDRANKVLAATSGSKGNSEKARKARKTAKEAKKAAKEAKKAARRAKYAAKYGTKDQRKKANDDAEKAAVEAREKALAAQKLLNDALEDESAPEPGVYPKGCGSPENCGKCKEPCEGDQECECRWAPGDPIPEGGSGGTKGKGTKMGTKGVPARPEGSKEGTGDNATKDPAKPKSEIERLIDEIEASELAKSNTKRGGFLRQVARALKGLARTDTKVEEKVRVLRARVDQLMGGARGLGDLSGTDRYRLEESLKSLAASQAAKSIVGELVAAVSHLMQNGLAADDRGRAIIARIIDKLQTRRGDAEEQGRRAVRSYLRENGFSTRVQIVRELAKVTGSAFRAARGYVPRTLEDRRMAEAVERVSRDYFRVPALPELGRRPEEEIQEQWIREQEELADAASDARDSADAEVKERQGLGEIQPRAIDSKRTLEARPLGALGPLGDRPAGIGPIGPNVVPSSDRALTALEALVRRGLQGGTIPLTPKQVDEILRTLRDKGVNFTDPRDATAIREVLEELRGRQRLRQEQLDYIMEQVHEADEQSAAADQGEFSTLPVVRGLPQPEDPARRFGAGSLPLLPLEHTSDFSDPSSVTTRVFWTLQVAVREDRLLPEVAQDIAMKYVEGLSTLKKGESYGGQSGYRLLRGANGRWTINSASIIIAPKESTVLHESGHREIYEKVVEEFNQRVAQLAVHDVAQEERALKTLLRQRNREFHHVVDFAEGGRVHLGGVLESDLAEPSLALEKWSLSDPNDREAWQQEVAKGRWTFERGISPQQWLSQYAPTFLRDIERQAGQ